MSWESILKFGPRQVPKPSLGSKRPTIDVENIKPTPKRPKPKFVVSLTQQYRGSLYGRWATLYTEDIQRFDTRDEAKEFLIKTMYEKGNPRPWTVEGNNVSGHCVVYDGIMLMINAPSYYYLIHKEGGELPDAASFNPRVDWTSREAVLDRLEGRPHGTTKRGDLDD